MAEEQGGEQIGRLWTEIGGDITPLEAVLAKAAEKLADFIKTEYKAKIGVQFENTGGSSARPQGLVDRHGKQLGVAIGQAALGEIETKISKIKDVKVEAKPKIDKDTLVAAVQGSLNGHAFKLTLDQEFIRGQIQAALGHGFQVGVGGAAAAASGGPGSIQHGLTQAFREEFDKRLNSLALNSSGKEKVSLGDAVSLLGGELRDILGKPASGVGPTSALEDLISDLGDDFSKWSEQVAKITGDPTLPSEFEALAKKFNGGQLHKDFFAARGAVQQQAPPPQQSPATFMAQAAQTIARAVQEAAPEPAEERRRRGTLQDRTFVGGAFNQDTITKFLGKYFTPELSRVAGSKNQPDFAALANLAELRPKEKGGRTAASGDRFIQFDPESASPEARRLQRGKPVRFNNGAVVPLSIAQVLRRGVSQLRGQPEDEFPEEVEERLAKITAVAQNAAKNVPTVKANKQNRSGILALGSSLQGFAQQDIRLDEVTGLIEDARKIQRSGRERGTAKLIGRIGRAGFTPNHPSSDEPSSKLADLVGQLQQEQAGLVQAGAQPISGKVSPFERQVLHGSIRRSSRQSRQAVDAGVGLTEGEIAENERRERRHQAAIQDASPFTRRVTGIVDELTGTERSLDSITSIRRFVNNRYQEIKKEAQEFFGGKLPSGVGQELAAARQSVLDVFDPKAGGTAVPRSGSGRAGTSTTGFTQGESFAEQDVRARERPNATPTGVVRPALETGVSKAIGDLESKLGLSSSERKRTATNSQGGVDAQTQFLVRRNLQRAIEAGTAAGFDILGTRTIKVNGKEETRPGLAPTLAGAKLVERIQSGEENDPIKKGEKDAAKLRKARALFAGTQAGASPDEQELVRLRGVRQRALGFIEQNANLGPEGIIAKSQTKRGAANILPREVIAEIKDALRIPASGEPNSVDRALGRDFIGERNKPLSGDELRKTFGRLAFTPPGPGAPSSLGGARELGVGTGVPAGASIGGGFTPGGGGPTATAGGGGFGGFPIPLPVIVTNDILRVSVGGGGRGRAASAADKAEDDKDPTYKSSRLPKRLRYRTPALTESAQDADAPFRRFSELARIKERNDRKPETVERQQFARSRRLRGIAQSKDPVGFSIAQDEEDKEAATLRKQLRVLNRRIPRRGFGASLTDLLSSVVPGHGALEKQLEAGDLAAREAAQITTTRSDRAKTSTTIGTLQKEIADPTTTPERREQLKQVLTEQQTAYKNQTKVIELSTDRFKKFYGEATKASTVLKSFGASAIGGAAAGGLGSLQFALGSVIAQPMLAAAQALVQVGATVVDRLQGNQAVAAATQTEQGQATRSAAGRAEVAFAQTRLSTGLGESAAQQIEQPITQRAQIEAGAGALEDQLKLFQSAQKYREQNKGRLGDAALSNNLTGALGLSIGGQPSPEETIAHLFENIPKDFAGGGVPQDLASKRDALTQQIADLTKQAAVEAPPTNDLFASTEERAAGGTAHLQLEKSQADLDALNKQIETVTGSFDDSNDALKFFNNISKDAGANLQVVAGGKLNPTDRQNQVEALFKAGLHRFAEDVQNGKIAFQQNGKAVTDPQEFVNQLLKITTSSPKPSPQAFLDAQAPQIRAQQYLTHRQLQFNLQQAPIQEGLDRSANPNLPATAGFAPADAKRYKTELSGVQSTFDSLAKDAAQARTDAVAFFQNAFPGDTSDAKAFADSLQKSAQYGQQIAKIQLGAETAQAAFEAKQYSFQIDLARRSLRDAKGLTGAITNDTQNLGVIERQQFNLQRESQSLSLGMSQRQINFQKAIAGLTAPGLTGEERAARIEQAKLEAEYAQKQLDIQKKLFGLGGKQFKITADRNVQDLTRQLGLLQQGREVTLRTAVAAKQIAALTQLQARENKRISAFYQAAVDATGQVMQLEAQLVANTEVGLNKVGNLVLAQFRKLYTGLINDLGGGYTGTGNRSNPADSGASSGHASGILGMASGATNLGIAGEAGNEAVAIIRNPRPFSAGGGGTSVVIDLRGSQVSTEDDRRKLIAEVQSAVERGLTRKGSVLGLR